MPPYPVGVIHGRFQVLHNDHLRYLLAGKDLCDHLVVGITNPDPTQTRDDSADAQRSTAGANPLTYFERYTMVRVALKEAGIAAQQFSVVPLPINLPELYRYYVPLDAVFFLSIYDHWGRRKRQMFEDLDLKTHVLREVSPEEKGLSAGDVRDKMLRGENWSEDVPPAVRKLLEKWEITQRLRDQAVPAPP